ncbi:double zinc ribbon domain-containing protein [Chromobacterium violaceum]|uniref:double zinc ribbon domain-containing protein n=1 Tax=Chromobacterium violaceum TaxID=536 RepID=UPI0009F11ED6|nr:hypothetical protein B0T41_00370 [Chromobacterium violaceum]
MKRRRAMSHFGKWFGGHHGSRKHDVHGRDDAAHRQERAAVLCPGCRQANDAAARFCQHCGTGLLPRRCGQCGQEAAAAAKFCAACGTGLR